MGTLLHRSTRTRHPLATRTIVGRNPMTQLWVKDRLVSNEHAVIWYEEGAWWVKDLRSRNGTFIGGHSLPSGEARALEEGDVLSFGPASDPWEFVDSGPPTAYAIHTETHRTLTAADDLLLIPDEEDPTVAVFSDGMGGWNIERDGELRAGNKVHEVEVDGSFWTLYLPFQNMSTWTETLATPSLPSLHFFVSSDEEHVELEVRAESTVRLPARTHTYFLLILARQRMRDREGDIPDAEQGWLHITDLCRMLKIDRATLNQRVFRARQQLASTKQLAAADVIERRSQSGQLRLGSQRVSEGTF